MMLCGEANENCTNQWSLAEHKAGATVVGFDSIGAPEPFA